MLPMMVVKSPRCDEQVTLPAGLTPESRVRCPFSKEEFLVQEILDDLPPMLEVIDGPAAAGAAVGIVEAESAGSSLDFLSSGTATETKDEAESASTGTALFESTPASDQPAASAFDFAAADAEASDATDSSSAGSPARRKARPRPQKKSKSAAAEMVKIVLGGIAGLIIAQMIMWWAMGKDPFKLARKLPSWLAWAAPESLRNPGAAKDKSEEEAENGEQTSSKGNGQEDPPQVPSQNDKVGSFDLPGSGTQAPDTDDSEGPDFGAGGPASNDDGGFGVRGPGDDLAAMLDEPDIDIGNPLEDDPVATPTEKVGVRNAPEFSGDDFGAALKSVMDTKEPVVEGGGMDLADEQKKKNAYALYFALCNLAERAAFVDPNGSQVTFRLSATGDQLRELGEKPGNLSAIGQLAVQWLLNGDKRPTNGISLAGTIRQISAAGELHNVDVELAGVDKQVERVVTKGKPKCKAGDRVLLLGYIVADPVENLVGYEGSLPSVIWESYTVVLPKPNKRGPGPRGGGRP